MSLSFSANFGSFDSLNGKLTSAAFANIRLVQCVAAPGGGPIREIDYPLYVAAGSGACRVGSRAGLNDSPFPHGVEQIILADHSITVLDQVDEQIEDLRSDIDQLGAAPQLAAIHVYRIFTELKWHSGLRRRRWCRGRPRRRKSRLFQG
jgi:hypothetical protein